jgi:hypothetical protein
MGVARMQRLSDEPALSFWLRYVEREGALVEDQGDHALVLLSDPLQQQSELPEEVSITADPDVAREDGAVLMIAGHPAVERAAGSVLAEGDTGSAYLPWPASRPPSRSTLEARARALAPVDNGRIDAAGEPFAAYLPLLRVGAMVSYAASLTLRFQEQEEALVDALTGTAPSERVLATFRNGPRLPRPDGRGRRLKPDLAAAIAAAHERLERRAAERQASLATQARRALDAELVRAEAYYEAALASIARRRAAATVERARMLDAQTEATRAERGRRRREIEEEYLPRHDVRPFRLQLVYLPAFVLPVEIRRGSRAFPFELTWMLGAAEFAAVRCPACGAAEPLVATRERLGCRACARSTAAGTPAAGPVMNAARPSEVSTPPGPDDDEAGRPSPPRVANAAESPRPRGHREARSGREGSRTQAHRPPAGSGGRHLRTRRTDPANLKRTGNKLSLAFWRCAANGARWPRQRSARDSPLRAAYRLYGNAGPMCAIGIAPDEHLEEIAASTYPSRAGAPELTAGHVKAGGEAYPFSILWWIAAGKPVVGEVLPAPHPLALPPPRGDYAEIATRLRERAPAPIVALDPVASQLWHVELEQSGLPFAIRCLATWWRLKDRVDSPAPDEAVAATVASAVGRATGARRASKDVAPLYQTDPRLMASTAHALKDELRLNPERGW